MLVLGLRSLRTPDDPIADPYFAVMELLILFIAPALVVLMAAVHAYAPSAQKVFSLTALVVTGMLAVLTSAIHIVILTVGRRISPAEAPWLAMFLSFRWPSVVYALDILAWDVFYPLSVLFAALVFRGSGIVRWARVALLLSGMLSLAGLLAVPIGDMSIRIVGIVGYAGLLPIVAVLIGIVFAQKRPAKPT